MKKNKWIARIGAYAIGLLILAFGVAFSVNFNKQFIALGKQQFNSRIISLLKMFDIEDRYISEKKHFAIERIDKIINYEEVKKIIDRKREESLLWLRKALCYEDNM